MNNNYTYNLSIAEIIASLEVRGFLDWSTRRINLDVQQVQLQLNAVMEELGELARVLRRHGQGRAPINHDELAVEAADIVIAAVCLFAVVATTAAGMDTDEILIAKLRSDEARRVRLAALRVDARTVRTDPRRQELTHGPLRRNHRSPKRPLTRRNRTHPRTLWRNRLHVRLGYAARRDQLRRRRAPLSHCPAAAREGRSNFHALSHRPAAHVQQRHHRL